MDNAGQSENHGARLCKHKICFSTIKLIPDYLHGRAQVLFLFIYLIRCKVLVDSKVAEYEVRKCRYAIILIKLWIFTILTVTHSAIAARFRHTRCGWTPSLFVLLDMDYSLLPFFNFSCKSKLSHRSALSVLAIPSTKMIICPYRFGFKSQSCGRNLKWPSVCQPI